MYSILKGIARTMCNSGAAFNNTTGTVGDVAHEQARAIKQTSRPIECSAEPRFKPPHRYKSAREGIPEIKRSDTTNLNIVELD